MPRKENLTSSSLAVSVQFIERRIYLIRGHKVMIDEDLADLYGVSTKRLNEQIRRNQKRFPDDFMFQLTKEESAILAGGGLCLMSLLSTASRCYLAS